MMIERREELAHYLRTMTYTEYTGFIGELVLAINSGIDENLYSGFPEALESVLMAWAENEVARD